MTEREHDPYWQEDVAIGDGTFFRGESSTIRMRLHTATERASRRHEIVPLSDAVQERVYVHGKPYILVPDITLTVGLYRQPDDGGHTHVACPARRRRARSSPPTTGWRSVAGSEGEGQPCARYSMPCQSDAAGEVRRSRVSLSRRHGRAS